MLIILIIILKQFINNSYCPKYYVVIILCFHQKYYKNASIVFHSKIAAYDSLYNQFHAIILSQTLGLVTDFLLVIASVCNTDICYI